jgi:hypothetical protein
MKLAPSSLVALGLAMTLAIGCSDSTGTLAPPPPVTPSLPAFPALTHPGAIYVEEGPVYQFFYAAQGRLTSRYVLYEDGTFELQLMSLLRGFFSYPGTYSTSGDSVAFDFTDRNSIGPWGAAGAVSGDELSVTYNEAMSWDDFIDGKYRKSQGTP